MASSLARYFLMDLSSSMMRNEKYINPTTVITLLALFHNLETKIKELEKEINKLKDK